MNAGLCTLRQGDVAGAESFFMQALKARPTQPQALYQLADIYYRRGDVASAKDYLAALDQLAIPVPKCSGLGCRVERKLGDRNAEASYAAQLRRSLPDSKEAGALSRARTNEQSYLAKGDDGSSPGGARGSARSDESERHWKSRDS